MKSINATVNTLVNGIKKHSPIILTAFGITGMFTTTILAVNGSMSIKWTEKLEKINEQRISVHAHWATNRHYENEDEQNCRSLLCI